MPIPEDKSASILLLASEAVDDSPFQGVTAMALYCVMRLGISEQRGDRIGHLYYRRRSKHLLTHWALNEVPKAVDDFSPTECAKITKPISPYILGINCVWL
jgi:hypothetical protein